MGCSFREPSPVGTSGDDAPPPPCTPGQPLWSKSYGGPDDELLAWRGVAVTDDGTAVLAGRRQTGAATAFYVIGVAPGDGALRWEHTYGGASGDEASSATPIAGGAVVCGTAAAGSLACTAGRLCRACLRLDSAGNTVWQRSWSGANQDFDTANAVVSAGSDLIVLGGSTATDPWVDFTSTRLDADGNPGTPLAFFVDGEDWAFDVRRAGDGTFIAVGSTGGYRACQQPWLMRYDAAGALLSSYNAGPCNVEAPGGGTAQRNFATSVALAADGAAVMAGVQWDGGTDAQGMIVKVVASASPQAVWRKSIGGRGDDRFQAIEALDDGGFLLVGSTDSASEGRDVLVVKIDGDGATAWTRTYGGPGNQEGTSLVRLAEGRYLIGATTDLGAGGTDILAFAIDAGACSPL